MRSRFWSVAVVLLGLSAASVAAGAEAIRFQFEEPVDLVTFLRSYERATGTSIVFDPELSGRVMLICRDPLDENAAFDVLQIVLELNGLTAVEQGGVLKIVPLKSARQEGGPVLRGGDLAAARSGMLTEILAIRHGRADDYKSVCYPLLSDQGALTVHAPSNSLVVTDRKANLERIDALIRALDRDPGPREIRSYALEHADAGDVLRQLERYLGVAGERQVARGPRIIADPRANRIIAGGSAEEHRLLAELIRELDQEAPPERSEVHVVGLTYADATDLAGVLVAQVREGESAGGPSITADRSTNSLIIRATPERFAELRSVIEELDRPRAQVLVEALIMETTIDRMKGLGVEWRLMDEPVAGSTRGAGGTNFPMDGEEGALERMARSPFDPPSGMAVGAVRGTITFGGVEYLNIGALLRAVQNDSEINILSTPQLVALDHEEATIVVGEERPFLKSTQVTDVGTVVKTFEFKDIGITLRLTPHVVQENYVLLDLFQEIKSFISESDVGAVTSTVRQAETSVLAADGQTVVIGGLIRDDQRLNRAQVPCLGGLPMLGWLFKAQRRAKTKTNLLIFITPHILTTPEGLTEASRALREGAPLGPGAAPPSSGAEETGGGQSDAAAPPGEPGS
jgi:general secretion pathway protein D